MPVLHIVIPVFNERDTLETCLRQVLAVPMPDGFTMQLRVIDDHSDPTNFRIVQRVIETLKESGHPIMLTRHDVNQGKGAALQTGFDEILSAGADDEDLVVIQDADLEYDPNDYRLLMATLLERDVDAVVGTRWGDHRPVRGLKRKIHAWGNGLLTRLSNAMTGYRISDMECCYKILPVRVLRQVRPMMTERRFGIEPQIIASLSRLGARVTEVPIHYDPRGMSAGKKIGWKDGIRAIWVIARERLRSSSSTSLTDSSPDGAASNPSESSQA